LTITLKQARDQAKKLLAEITLGVQQNRTISYKDARNLFLECCEAKNKKNTVDYYRKRLDAHFRFGRKRALLHKSAERIHVVNPVW
jgi:hypothetical protein